MTQSQILTLDHRTVAQHNKHSHHCLPTVGLVGVWNKQEVDQASSAYCTMFIYTITTY